MRACRLALFAYVLLACAAVNAQESQQQDQARHAIKLSVRIDIHEGAGPTFYPLGDVDGTPGGALFGNVASLPSARFRSEPVHTLLVRFSRKGDGALVVVFVQSGRAESFREEKVAEFALAEGAEYVVSQLANYGVRPMRLALIRRAEVELKPPAVQNRTQAVEVSEIKVHEEVPSFEMVLKNVSERDITAVEIQERRGMMPKGPPPLFDWKSLPLIKPGKTFKVTLEFGWNSKVTPEGHVVEPADTVVINSVLFSDGSYEGNSNFAAHARAFKAGRKMQLARALEIIRGWDEPPVFDTRSAAKELGARIAALECTAEWEAVTELAGHYSISQGAELDRIKESFEEGMRWQRGALWGELAPYILSQQTDYEPRAVHAWVKTIRERFEKALAGI